MGISCVWVMAKTKRYISLEVFGPTASFTSALNNLYELEIKREVFPSKRMISI